MPEEINLDSIPAPKNNKPQDAPAVKTAADAFREYLAAPIESVIPWELTELPSKGMYYDWADGEIKVRAMSQKAEQVLATQRLAQTGQSIDYLFNECVQLPNNMDPSELLVGDRMYILYYIRGITHGNMYEFGVTCPNDDCGRVSQHTYDLNDLASTIKWADPSIGKEPFDIHLPRMSESVGLDSYAQIRFLRGYDTNEILAKKRAKRKMTEGSRSRVYNTNYQKKTIDSIDTSLSDNLAKLIVSVNGVNDQFAIGQFVNKMHAADIAEIREFLKQYTPGIDNTVTISCPECENDFNIQLPISDSFFRPVK